MIKDEIIYNFNYFFFFYYKNSSILYKKIYKFLKKKKIYIMKLSSFNLSCKEKNFNYFWH